MTEKKTQKPEKQTPDNIDVKKKKKGISIFKGGTKYSPEELAKLVAEFILYAMDDTNKTACTRAGFILYIFKNHGYFIGEQTLLNYQKMPGFEGIVQSLTLAQRAQLEDRSLFAVMGQGSVMALMLKNVGYQDKVTTEIIDDTLFEAVIAPTNGDSTDIDVISSGKGK